MTEDTTLPPQTYTARTLSSLFSLFFSILQILAVGLFVLEQGKTGVCVLKLGLTGHSSVFLLCTHKMHAFCNLHSTTR